MATKKRLPMSVVTNPIWLWLFKHGWEDPEWGRRPVDQIGIQLALRDLAGLIADDKVRTGIQSTLDSAIAKTARAIG